ncbi:MAG: PKD domain-containing protein [Lentimicrobiaceae bacterium]|nr:PKD domain-containing protein [Lentimicrobiaceae bacterium]
MKKIITLLLIICFFITKNVFCQETVEKIFQGKKEVYFHFPITSTNEISYLTKIISIDNVKQNTIWAYANKKQFSKFIKLGYNYTILPAPSLLCEPHMLDNIDVKQPLEWDFYPTYTAYESMMYQFEQEHPDICKIITIGTLPSGRKLLAAKITDNLDTNEDEPEFLYTSSMHGDETTGYVLMLHLIDYLLNNYTSDPRITNMVNNMEIWINPLANPDGTYAGGNSTVNGATRSNDNGVDLNRNYPDFQNGLHPDGEEWQPETILFMDFASQHHFVMGANFHGGAEVFNYPWDTKSELTADNNWWVFVGRQFADTVHENAPNGYFVDLENGITNGYAWYEVDGGRQDYMNFYHNCREVTIELSSTKLLNASQLPAYWNYDYRSFLNYMEQSLYGIRGVVTDAVTGLPVCAKVFIPGHDDDSSFVYSSTESGDYHRLIKAGSYNLTFSAPCYESFAVNNIFVSDLNTTIENVQLQPIPGLSPSFEASKTNLANGETITFSDHSCGNPVSWSWTFEGGNPASSTEQNPAVIYSTNGTFDVTLVISDGTNSQTLVKNDYITVANTIIMQNGTITTCSGNFYDTGGESESYNNNEDYTFTILPVTATGKVKAEFTSFDVEYDNSCDYDWLKIYNGTSVSAALIGTFCGTNSPGTVVATNEQGALTFSFHSDYGATGNGWSAILSCDDSMGTGDEVPSSVKIYPNPITQDKLYIEAPFVINSVRLLDITGKIVAAANPEAMKTQLNVASLYSGIFIVEITSGNFKNFKKIQVIK